MPALIRLACFAALSALSVRGHSAIQSTMQPAKEVTAMSAPGSSETIRENPELGAGQALMRLLDLIRESHSIACFTPERVGEAMGIGVTRHGQNQFGFSKPLNADWVVGLDFNIMLDLNTLMKRPMLSFGFGPKRRAHVPSMAAICQVDFETYSASLQAMGFTRETTYGEHGRIVEEGFAATGKPYVRIRTRGESSANAGHRCIEEVLIK